MSGSLYKRLIYSFEFPDKSVYVGLTLNSTTRKNEHLNPKRSKKSSVYKYIIESGLQPKFNELTEYIDSDFASKKEGEFVERYRNDGWKILNRMKTGGLGGNIIKLTKEICILEALKYNTKSEWRTGSSSTYVTSKRNKWLNECTKHMKSLNIKWSYEKVIDEASKYLTKSEWRLKSKKSYNIAILNGWVADSSKHMKILWEKKWDFNACKNDALKYGNKVEWNDLSNGAYSAARKNGWLKECSKYMKRPPVWNKGLKFVLL